MAARRRGRAASTASRCGTAACRCSRTTAPASARWPPRVRAARRLGLAADAADFALAYVEGFHAAAPARASAVRARRAAGDRRRRARRRAAPRPRRLRRHRARRLADDAAPRACGSAPSCAACAGAAATSPSAPRRARRPRAAAGRAAAPLVTLPLGVLQARAGAARVAFAPSLPPPKRARHRRARRRRRRQDRARLSRAVVGAVERRARHSPLASCTSAAPPSPTWWRPLPLPGADAMGWAAGPAARRLRGRARRRHRAPRASARSRARSRICRRRACASSSRRGTSSTRPRDPFAAGAYSWVPVGALERAGTARRGRRRHAHFAGEAANAEGKSAHRPRRHRHAASAPPSRSCGTSYFQLTRKRACVRSPPPCSGLDGASASSPSLP